MTDTTSSATENVNRLGDASRRSANDISALAKKLEQSFGAIFTGVPKKISELDVLPSTLSKGIGFLEGNLEILQKFSKFGVNFGNEMDLMIKAAGRANLRLNELGSIIQESSTAFGALGPTINQGLENFLARQAKFFKDGINLPGFENAERDLRRLGMTALEINERFLQYDKIAAFTSIRNRQSEQERNVAAYNFAKSMDRLSKLTGEQADRLAKERVELMREGDVSARAEELSENVQDVYGDTIQELSKVSPMIGKLTKDILTKGVPDPRDPEMQALYSFAGPLGGTLEQLNAALESGNRELAIQLKERAMQEAINLRYDKNIASMAKLGGISEITGAMAKFRTELNKSSLTLSDGYIRRMIADEKKIKLEEVTSDMVIAKRNQILRDQERAQTGDQGGPGKAATDLLIEALTQAQKASMAIQSSAVDTVFKNVESSANYLREKIAAIDFQKAAESALKSLGGVFGRTGTTLTDAQRLDNYARQLSIAAASTQDAELSKKYQRFAEDAAKLANLSRSGITSFTVEQEAMINDIRNAVMNLEVADIRVGTLHTDVIINRNVGNQSSGSREPNSIGTLGNIGRLFKDYGTGTDVTLHNVESVQTPRQVAEVMRASAIGTMQALVDELNRGTATTLGSEMRKSLPDIQGATKMSMSSINGMLNTMRTLPQQTAQTSNVIDLSKLEKVMSDLPISIKRPMEEAVSTLKTPLEQLAQTVGEQLTVQQKQLRSIDGLNNDMLRG